MDSSRHARFALGQVVRHRENAFRGIVVDADAAYAGPVGEPGPVQPDQPFYQVFAVGLDGGFLVYVAEDALELDGATRLAASDHAAWFTTDAQGRHAPKSQPIH